VLRHSIAVRSKVITTDFTMLKRIPIEELRLGMYVHELCGSWMDHPFWTTTFLLDNEKDRQAILAGNLKELWIDTDKGLDLAGGESVENVKQVTEAALAKMNQAVKPVARVDIAQEAARAVKICAQAKSAITSMFHEARMGKALNGAEAVAIVAEISNSVTRNPAALISLARLKSKDDYTYMHSVAVCALMVALARQLSLNDEQTRQAGLAGLLHDVGKMMIAPDILNKPGKLTEAEFAAIKEHPAQGHKLLLEGSDISSIALDVCLHHHEKMDGSGYPDKLADEGISLYAKMAAVCDVYDAITSNRPYKNGWEPAESIRKMAEWQNGHFAPAIFEAFVRSIGIYPVGSLVQLESGRLAVVIEQSEKSLLTPKIKVFFSIKANSRIPLEIVDLSRPGCKDKIHSHEQPEKWGITDVTELWSGITPVI